VTIQADFCLVAMDYVEAPFQDSKANRAKPGTMAEEGLNCPRLQPEWNIQSGRPNIKSILSVVAAVGGTGPSGVFACGPEGLLEETKAAVVALNRDSGRKLSRQFLLHVEVFTF
jgi:hypothetical protein